jgi:hypothetical protein
MRVELMQMDRERSAVEKLSKKEVDRRPGSQVVPFVVGWRLMKNIQECGPVIM